MRYITMGAGNAQTAAALSPVLPPTPRATTYTQVVINGQPGTMGVPAPKPNALPMNSQTRATQPSWGSPDVIFPSLYWTTAANMHPPVSLFRDNQMPVPAVPSYRVPQPAQRRRRTGGQEQVAQPAVVQVWPGLAAVRSRLGG